MKLKGENILKGSCKWFYWGEATQILFTCIINMFMSSQTATTNSRFWTSVRETSLLHSRSSSSIVCIPTNKSILTEKYPPDKTTTTSTWRRGRRACTMFGTSSQTRFPSRSLRRECQATDGYHVSQVCCSGEQREKSGVNDAQSDQCSYGQFTFWRRLPGSETPLGQAPVAG